MRRLAPEIVYVSISGFGPSGPYVGKRVYDPVIQMLSGMVETQTDPAVGKPDFVRNIVCDNVTSLTAAQAITAALLVRATGQGGQRVRLAMLLDAAVAFPWPDAMINETFVGGDVKRGLTMSDVYAVFDSPRAHGSGAARDRQIGSGDRAPALCRCRFLSHRCWRRLSAPSSLRPRASRCR